MAVEILRHMQSGEYYAVQYAPNREPRINTISRVCGPLTRSEAIMAFDNGDLANDDPEDAEWAHTQPWQVIPAHSLHDIHE